MRLMTKEIAEKLPPLGSTDGQGEKAEVIVKYFNPVGIGTWYITEGDHQPDGDWLLYGLCELYEKEWGYVSLNELRQLQLPFGMKIERDLYSHGTVAELANLPIFEEEEIDLLHESDKVYRFNNEIFNSRVALEDAINVFAVQHYDDYLDEICGEVQIGSLTYSASYVLKNTDPIAYRCGIDDYEETLWDDVEELDFEEIIENNEDEREEL